MLVRVPASSANLGPGFDALGMALTLHAEVGAGEAPEAAQAVDEHHPAAVAFRAHGGEGPLWVRSPIPVGRGMGFSGAVRVGGLVAAHAQRHGADHDALQAALPELLRLAAALEGHADNVAASLYGGLAAGEVDALRVATQDRLHQDVRLAAAEPSRAALDAALAAGAWAAWLSGSGPTVAAMCAVDEAEQLAAALPADGHTKILRIDHAGAVIEGR